MKLVFATNNKHKLEEISHLLEGEAEIGSLAEIGCQEDIPEDHDTLEENALQKARYIKEHYGYDCFADDTGLEIEALDKRPGVYSARYAGPAKDSVENMKKVLREMEGISDRKACFRTVIALISRKRRAPVRRKGRRQNINRPTRRSRFRIRPDFSTRRVRPQFC